LAGGSCRPPHPRFPQRPACHADGSLPRATKRFLPCARTCALVRLFAAEIYNNETVVALITAAALAVCFTAVNSTQSRTQSPRTHNLTFSLIENSAESPLGGLAYVVNSEPHTGARPSARLCEGVMIHHLLVVFLNTTRSR
jgi:hypothetical protein